MSESHPGKWLWRCGTRTLDLERRLLVMGIVNATPDSFSDGGLHAAPEAAVAHGMRLIEDGADMLDIGGESTRPGAEGVSEADELRRVIPVIAGLRAAGATVPISIDTSKAAVAREALAAGAEIINDVSALRGDAAMAKVAAQSGAGVVLMHMLGTPRTMQIDPRYDDVVREVGAFLEERLRAAVDAGIDAQAIVLDPGLGFGKTFEHNLALLRRMSELAELARRPLLVGPSRKAYIGRVTGLRPEARGGGTAAACVFAAARGARIFRVHDVREVASALRVAQAILFEG